MYPINNLEGIVIKESHLIDSHAIIFLFVKPSDENAENIISKFNYLHYKSKKFCSIYLIGYSEYKNQSYDDLEEVTGINHTTWYYSDQCFIDVCDKLENRLKNWRYSGEPEMIILQNSSSAPNGHALDFRNYNYIDINYGIQHSYIDSFSRFMERIIRACKSETEASRIVTKANITRLNCRRIVELAIDSDVKLPAPVKRILKDKAFFKTFKDGT